jgi:hypothetical protein
MSAFVRLTRTAGRYYLLGSNQYIAPQPLLGLSLAWGRTS